MAADGHLTYPGFNISFLIPLEQNTDELEQAIAKIRRDLVANANRHLPFHCQIEIQVTAQRCALVASAVHSVPISTPLESRPQPGRNRRGLNRACQLAPAAPPE